jgi:hypothetical protein
MDAFQFGSQFLGQPLNELHSLPHFNNGLKIGRTFRLQPLNPSINKPSHSGSEPSNRIFFIPISPMFQYNTIFTDRLIAVLAVGLDADVFKWLLGLLCGMRLAGRRLAGLQGPGFEVGQPVALQGGVLQAVHNII